MIESRTITVSTYNPRRIAAILALVEKLVVNCRRVAGRQAHRFIEDTQSGLWTITADPLYLEFGGVDMYVDLAAEKMIAAEKEGRKIAVEIKSFSAPSLISKKPPFTSHIRNSTL